jgi:glycosyltransferase involved in cell wall biosynthesis
MQYWFEKWRTKVDGTVVLLGTDPLPPLSDLPAPAQSTPYFVCLGTIEPRKNHQLLLDVWADFHKSLPDHEISHLHIIGRRGWLNEDVFDTLDNADFMGKTVFEHGQIPDERLGPLLRCARGLLFPTFAEGFGYPLVEALQMGVRVICSVLPCFHEIAGDAPEYCDVSIQSEWSAKILLLSSSNASIEKLEKNIPEFANWCEHFHKIDTILNENV